MHRISEELTKIKELIRLQPQGMSITDIAQVLGKNKHSVGRYLDILHAAGHVDLRTFGMAKVYTLSSRVPLSALLSYATDLVLVLDQGNRVLQINDPFLALISLERNAVVMQELQYLRVPDPGVHDLITTLTSRVESSTGKEESDEITLDTKPPRIYHLKIVPTVFDDGTGGTTIILEDVTAERVALKKARESEEFFRSVSEHISDGILVIENDKIIFMNEMMTNICGYSKEELEKMGPHAIAANDEKERFCKAKKYIENHLDMLKSMHFWAVHKDGSPLYLFARMSQVRFGERLRWYILITNMTEWKIQGEKEELQFTLMRQILNQNSHPMFITGPDKTLFIVNSAFCQLLGYTSEEEVTGRSLHDLVKPELSASFYAGDEDLKSKSGHINQQILFPGPGETAIPYIVEKTAVTAGEGGEVYIFGVVILENCTGSGIIPAIVYP
ncbi:MAG TPA: PAS domain S-box protein [Methanospirillum sp.]|nr:PAS domain S-box protein [Methanospirillum sp.]